MFRAPVVIVLALVASNVHAQAGEKPLRVRKECPPTFFVHAYNDGVKAENSIAMFLALKQAGVPAELHIYTTGGHGFGLRPSDHPISRWPERCADWLRNQGILKR